MYMGSEPTVGNYGDQLQSLGDRWNAAANQLRVQAGPVLHFVNSIQDLGPYAADEAVLVQWSDGTEARMLLGDFSTAVDEIEFNVSMVANRTQEQVAAASAAGITAHEAVNAPVYVVPTSTPADTSVAAPIVPNEPENNVQTLPAPGAPAPGIVYYNLQGQPYGGEDYSVWQSPSGQWQRGDKAGNVVNIPAPSWAAPATPAGGMSAGLLIGAGLLALLILRR